MIREVTDQNFNSEVLISDKLSVVHFSAQWSGASREVNTVMKVLANTYGQQANIGELNVDVSPDVTAMCRIASVPTILFIKDGKVLERLTSDVPLDQLEDKIKVHL
jgi:thioredoxin 1